MSKKKWDPKLLLGVYDPSKKVVFHDLEIDFFGPRELRALRQQFDGEIYLDSAKDDRSLVLVGALCVERAIDKFLKEVMPRGNALFSRRDLTNSLKIDIARYLDFVPRQLFTRADLIRSIRNEFAHDLKINRIGKIKKEFLNKLRDFERGIVPNRLPRTRKVKDAFLFVELVRHVCKCLMVYSIHMKSMRDYLQSDTFLSELKIFHNEKYPEKREEHALLDEFAKILKDALEEV